VPAAPLHSFPAGPGWGFSLAAWAPLGAAGARAPRAGSASRGGLRLEPEHGDGAGWAGEQIPQPGTRRSPRKPQGFGG